MFEGERFFVSGVLVHDNERKPGARAVAKAECDLWAIRIATALNETGGALPGEVETRLDYGSVAEAVTDVSAEVKP